MNRRRFVAAVMAGCAFVPVMQGVAQTPVAGVEALEVATVGFRASADDGIRTISARVSLWPDEHDAAWFQEFLANEAGSDLPDGEFYQSPLEEWKVPGVPDDLTVTAIEWNTTVGVAAYRTEWIQVTMRRGSHLWDIWISGAERELVRDLATDLMGVLGERIPPPCGTLELEEYLPQPEDVPDGMEIVDFEPGAASDGQFWLTIPDVPVIPPATPVDTGCGGPE
jgi:hypothetical protein